MASGKKNSDYAQYQAAIAAHKEISIMRGYLEIRAPFDGVVAARNVNLGTFVGPAGKGSDLPLLIFPVCRYKFKRLYVPIFSWLELTCSAKRLEHCKPSALAVLEPKIEIKIELIEIKIKTFDSRLYNCLYNPLDNPLI